MDEKKKLYVRIPIELYEKIEDTGSSKVDIVIKALNQYFDIKSNKEDIKEDIKMISTLKEQNEFLKNQIDEKDRQISQINKTHEMYIIQVQSQLQEQKLITSSEKSNNKRWFEFWK